MARHYSRTWRDFYSPLLWLESPMVRNTYQFLQHKEDDGLHLTAEIPGFSPEEVKVTVEDHVLQICGDHEHNDLHDTFSRSFSMPEDANADKITASVKNGILEIIVPLAKKPEPKVIQVTN